jgi:hypothetical protein
MARQLDIGVDLDGVCYDFVGALRTWINGATGRALDTMAPAQSWDFWRDQWDLSLDEFLGFYADAVHAGFMFIQGDSYPGAIAGFRRLAEAGHRLHVVTARAPRGAVEQAEINTRIYLEANQMPYTSLTFSDRKGDVPTDIFFEDAVHNYVALEEAGFHPWLYTQGWNESFPARRVSGWPQFEEVVAQLAGTAALAA